jgi:hypothetical protein
MARISDLREKVITWLSKNEIPSSHHHGGYKNAAFASTWSWCLLTAFTKSSLNEPFAVVPKK